MSAPPEIDGYSELSQVARGGFGVVYRARQSRFDRVVALKVLSVTDLTERDRERFDRECRAMGALSWHPNVVAVYDSGITDDGHPYLVMEYLSAGSLADHLADGVEPWPDSVRAGIQVAGALGAAHAAGTLHRDLKPENLLRGPFGEAKLGDFGIAAIEGSGHTTTGHASLTVAHVAPEIMAGERPDAVSDVYSLASTVHTLLAGRPPFSGERGEPVAALITRVLRAPAPRADGVPDDLADLLQRSLSKDPGARPQTAEEFGRALQAVEAANGLAVTALRLGATSGRRDDDPVEPEDPAAGRGDSAVTVVGMLPVIDPPPEVDAPPADPPRPPSPPTEPVQAVPAPPTATAPPAAPAAPLVEEEVAPPVEEPPPAVEKAASAAPDPPPPGGGSRRRLVVVGAVVVVLLALVAGVVLLGGGSDDGNDEGNDGGGDVAAEQDQADEEEDAGGQEAAAVDPVVVTDIPVDPNPVGIAAVEDAIWVTHTVDAGTVTRIDPATDQVVATIDVGAQPRGIAATDDAVWVANFDDGTVSRIDPATDTVVATINMGGQPRGVAVFDDVVWVTDFESGTLARIDPATDAITETIPVGAEPVRVEASADQVWVTNNADDSVTRIDPETNTAVATIETGDGPVSATITPGAVWVSHAEGATVVRIDPATDQVVATIDVTAGVVFTAASSDALWVANQITGELNRIDLANDELTDTLDTGNGTTGVAISDGAVWVTNTGDETVGRVEPAD